MILQRSETIKKEASSVSPWKEILAKDIDEYLAALPEAAKVALQKLRETIKVADPEATEAIYYRIPTFMHEGPLVGFSASKNHCSLHLMSPPLMAAHRDELKAYDTTTATIRFPFDKPLPVPLVTMLVKERMTENEKRAKK
jgi:uncharacterized protein YdhG (YjbR/CyaY superfamily)